LLSLKNNQLEVLPKGLGSMFKLQKLFLAHNRFASIDGGVLASLVSLVELDLSHNVIEGAVPAKLFRLAKLRILDLSHNRISDIPGDVRGLIGLVELHLDSNLLESIPARELALLKKLEVLTLDHNLLKGRCLDGLATAPKLKVLRFDHNPISRCAEASLDKLGALRSRALHLSVVADKAEDDDYDSESHSDRYRLYVQLSRARLRQARGASAGTESLERGEFEEALKSLQSAVAAAPTDPLAHFAEGLAHVGCARGLAPAHGDALAVDDAELQLLAQKKRELDLARASLTTAALHLEQQNYDAEFVVRPELF
jgi:Leucine-rich repeat (LRR) protein